MDSNCCVQNPHETECNYFDFSNYMNCYTNPYESEKMDQNTFETDKENQYSTIDTYDCGQYEAQNSQRSTSLIQESNEEYQKNSQQQEENTMLPIKHSQLHILNLNQINHTQEDNTNNYSNYNLHNNNNDNEYQEYGIVNHLTDNFFHEKIEINQDFVQNKIDMEETEHKFQCQFMPSFNPTSEKEIDQEEGKKDFILEISNFNQINNYSQTKQQENIQKQSDFLKEDIQLNLFLCTQNNHSSQSDIFTELQDQNLEKDTLSELNVTCQVPIQNKIDLLSENSLENKPTNSDFNSIQINQKEEGELIKTNSQKKVSRLNLNQILSIQNYEEQQNQFTQTETEAEIDSILEDISKKNCLTQSFNTLEEVQIVVKNLCDILRPFCQDFDKLNQKIQNPFNLKVITLIRDVVVKYYKNLGKPIISQDKPNQQNHCMCGLDKQYKLLSGLTNHIKISHPSTPVWCWSVKINKKVGRKRELIPEELSLSDKKKIKQSYAQKAKSHCLSNFWQLANYKRNNQ